MKVSDALLRLVVHCEAHYQILEKSLNIEESDNGVMLLPPLSGLPDICVYTCQPLFKLDEDAPELFCHTLEQCTEQELVKKARKALGHHC